MVSSGIQRFFYVTWTIIKLNLLFIVGSLAGGIVLGIGPSFQTLNDLLQTHGIDYQELTVRAFFEQWKKNWVRGNQVFWIFVLAWSFVGYNLYLSTQLLGLLWLMIDFILLIILMLLFVFYIYCIQYETNYETSLKEIIKLAFISLFLGGLSLVKMLFGLVSIVGLTWYFKGLFLFASFSLILIFAGYATKEVRELVDRKLG